MVLDLNPQIDIATKRDIRIVKVMNKGKAYFLKKPVQHPIIIDIANIPTVTTMITGIYSMNLLNAGLL